MAKRRYPRKLKLIFFDPQILDKFWAYQPKEPLTKERYLLYKKLNKGIKKLTHRQRSCLKLRFWKQYSTTKIANKLKISRRTVRVHIERAINKLRKFLVI
ncbi:MAG: RNA polymerase sigma factor [Promethearchaeota archaeon]